MQYGEKRAKGTMEKNSRSKQFQNSMVKATYKLPTRYLHIAKSGALEVGLRH